MPLNLFYTMVQKSQKWPKTQIKGGSCLKRIFLRSISDLNSRSWQVLKPTSLWSHAGVCPLWQNRTSDKINTRFCPSLSKQAQEKTKPTSSSPWSSSILKQICCP